MRALSKGVLLGATVAILVAGPASAETRFASPAGSGAGNCTSSDPVCTLEHALSVAVGGDTVSLAASGTTYSLGATLEVSTGHIHIAGPGTGHATINANGTGGVRLTGTDTSLRGVTIVNINGVALTVNGDDAVAERVTAVSNTTSGASCILAPSLGTITLTEVVCTANSTAPAISVVPFNSATINLGNVTVSAADAGSPAMLAADASPHTDTIHARNSIFHSPAGGPADIVTSGSGSITVDSDFSAYADVTAGASAGGIVPPGTASNILGDPLFEGGSLNKHQAAGSPTIDKGTAAGLPVIGLGEFDVDGDPRSLSGTGICADIPDIGADEFTGNPKPASCNPPAGGGSGGDGPSGPSGGIGAGGTGTSPKKCRKKKAKKRAYAAKKKKCKKRKKR